jgi:hypothetical protein
MKNMSLLLALSASFSPIYCMKTNPVQKAEAENLITKEQFESIKNSLPSNLQFLVDTVKEWPKKDRKKLLFIKSQDNKTSITCNGLSLEQRQTFMSFYRVATSPADHRNFILCLQYLQ